MVDKITNPPSQKDLIDKVNELVDDKQDTLVSGTNIKTINNTSILGSGNIDIQGGGGSYTAGTGIDITNNVISVTSPTLVNTATGTNSLTIFSSNICTYRGGINIGPSATSLDWGTALGLNSFSGNQGVSIGYNSKARGTNSVAIGGTAQIGLDLGIEYAIQLGYGTNSESNSFYVGTSSSDNWKMLGSDGKIPSGRLPIATSVSSSSTNADAVGAKLFYDTVGDIETALHTINSGGGSTTETVNLTVILTGTPTALSTFIINNTTYTYSDFTQESSYSQLVVPLTKNTDYSWTAASSSDSGRSPNPSSGTVNLSQDDSLTINITIGGSGGSTN